MPARGTKLHPITGCRVDSLFEDVWLIGPEQLEARVKQVVQIDLNQLVKDNHEAEQREREQEAKLAEGGDGGPESKTPYRLLGDVAVITISGLTTKYPTSFERLMGGTSTVQVQHAIRHALANEEVSSILLHIDGCPGGNAAGAYDLADEIRRADAVKPVIAHIDDQGTSAATLFASQARMVSANKNAQVGSIGVVTKLEDTSKAYEARGVRVIPIVSGKMKGVGMDGVRITPEQVAEIEDRVKELDNLFVAAVSEGRNLPEQKVRALEARTFIAERAKKYGLVDRIQPFDVTLAEVKAKKYPESAKRGPAPEKTPPAAESRRVMLKPEQLQQAKQLLGHGAAHLTVENADEVLLGSVISMSSEITNLKQQVQTAERNVPKPKIDPALAEGHAKLFLKDLELQVKDGKLLPTQRDLLKAALCPEDGKFNLGLVQSDGTVLLPADVVIKTVESNKPNGVGADLTGAQPAPKTEPGKDQPAIPSFEQVNASRATYNLAPITPEEYRKQYPTGK